MLLVSLMTFWASSASLYLKKDVAHLLDLIKHVLRHTFLTNQVEIAEDSRYYLIFSPESVRSELDRHHQCLYVRQFLHRACINGGDKPDLVLEVRCQRALALVADDGSQCDLRLATQTFLAVFFGGVRQLPRQQH